jgi:hypothetical protein
VPGNLEAALARHRILPLLDGGVVELLDAPHFRQTRWSW